MGVVLVEVVRVEEVHVVKVVKEVRVCCKKAGHSSMHYIQRFGGIYCHSSIIILGGRGHVMIPHTKDCSAYISVHI